MVTHRGSARRYAEAAFEIAERDQTVDAWLGDLDTAATDLGESGAVHLLSNPAVPIADREKVVRDVLGTRVSAKTVNLLLLLVRRGRADLLGSVATEFRRLYDRREGISHATVTSAAPLEDAEVGALRERLTSITGGRVEVAY
jgi:F-type H+-transporting ATPase subunit delta